MKHLIGSFALVLIVGLASPAWGETENPHYLTAPASAVDRAAWLDAAANFRQQSRRQVEEQAGPDAWAIYNRPELVWMSRSFASAMCMMYDTDFYDAAANRYLIDAVLDDGEREFGGYSSIVLWHAYPRLGFDERNQFDFYREMPGGLAGLRKLVDQCHARQVRVFVDYNPWDTGTRREGRHDYEVLAEIVAAINADGVFLDTLDAGSQQLRTVLDRVKAGLAIVSEGHPPVEQLAICSGSWGQWLQVPQPPGILKLKWIEPRHMQYQIRRWDRSRSEEVATAFFNGSGVLIWENVFGTYSPWTTRDRATWKKAKRILDHFAGVSSSVPSQPYYPAKVPQVFINHWSTPTCDLFVLQNTGQPIPKGPLLQVECDASTRVFDLWNGRKITPNVVDSRADIACPLVSLGCVLVARQGADLSGVTALLKACAEVNERPVTTADSRNALQPTVDAESVATTEMVPRSSPPEGMVYVPGCVKTFEIEHIRGECGCYPDSQSQVPTEDFGYGLATNAEYPSVIHQPIRHRIGPLEMKPFFIDETEVTNAMYRQFLAESGYQPRHRENFLKHWPEGNMPEALADHPVVNVDLDDARAYARWAGKRLPTEFEWQLAAQGPDSRKWPWGDEFDPAKCNSTGAMTLSVRSCPDGRSPYGCYHMAGNVWEWTESCRDDGHTRFTMLRGGSYYKAEGSIWYAEGGPQPCGHHAKFIRIWPGLDRCSTVGFRCVVDAE